MQTPNYRGSLARLPNMTPVRMPALPLRDENGQLIVEEDGSLACTHWVREMVFGDREKFEMASTVEVAAGEVKFDRERARSELLLRTWCDECGERLFGDDELEALRAVSADLTPLFLASLKLNGFAGEEKKS